MFAQVLLSKLLKLHETDEVNHFCIMFNIGALLTLVSLVGFQPLSGGLESSCFAIMYLIWDVCIVFQVHSPNTNVEVFDTVTWTPVQSNVIQHNSSAITPTFVKLIMFNICCVRVLIQFIGNFWSCALWCRYLLDCNKLWGVPSTAFYPPPQGIDSCYTVHPLYDLVYCGQPRVSLRYRWYYCVA